MKKREKFIIVTYEDIEIARENVPWLRGFFADIDYQDDVLHNHLTDGTAVYRYPLIQYKAVRKHPTVVAFSEGIDTIYPKVMANTSIRLGEKVYENPKIDIKLQTHTIGDARNSIGYKFMAPWLGLNQSNYKKYKECNAPDEKTAILNSVLIGNILSMCKGFGVNIEQKLAVESELKEVSVRYKDEDMIGFKGTFSVNAHIPDLCGIGKGVSIGMGTVAAVQKG